MPRKSKKTGQPSQPTRVMPGRRGKKPVADNDPPGAIENSHEAPEQSHRPPVTTTAAEAKNTKSTNNKTSRGKKGKEKSKYDEKVEKPKIDYSIWSLSKLLELPTEPLDLEQGTYRQEHPTTREEEWRKRRMGNTIRLREVGQVSKTDDKKAAKGSKRGARNTVARIPAFEFFGDLAVAAGCHPRLDGHWHPLRAAALIERRLRPAVGLARPLGGGRLQFQDAAGPPPARGNETPQNQDDGQTNEEREDDNHRLRPFVKGGGGFVGNSASNVLHVIRAFVFENAGITLEYNEIMWLNDTY
ncbi:hypothetical protein K470DRAFT_276408 [Piedraia hortae CBS 480.64]|uniref:Uncharacterized protein n=1 Tax=Piedraia hortae CBS 480.64 TaxID=1314780 RepID=A0A6A7C208_9PEZI|nr:hypothetical protein K470DRAFT_276408 [Piedraia hortae CBS 480.64]